MTKCAKESQGEERPIGTGKRRSCSDHYRPSLAHCPPTIHSRFYATSMPR